MTSKFVSLQRQGRVAVLRFNRPQTRNAIATHQDCRDIVAALEELDEDPALSCGVLTGEGSAFCAGGDLKSMKARSGIGPLASPDDTRSNYRRGVGSVIRALWNCETPLVAAINGPAIGLGLDLSCLCDIRIAATEAKLGSTFIKVGLVPGDGGAWILPRVVGPSKAAQMILTGEILTAPEALACGLVSKVVPGESLAAEALDMARQIASNPPRTLRLSKRLLREGQQSSLSEVLELSAAFQALAHETRDHAEAVDAFLEKREPNFTGE